VCGLSTQLTGALVGKAEVFRFFFGSQNWTMFSHMAIGFYYTVPMVSIFYFMSDEAIKAE